MSQNKDYKVSRSDAPLGQTPSGKQKAQGPSRQSVWKMFDRIAHRYDLLNHLLSLNRDKFWRKKVASYLPNGDKLAILDLATGTGDQLIALADSGRVERGLGLDLSEKMLDFGRTKIDRLKLGDRLTLNIGDAESIPCKDESFDAVTISFGIRNVNDVLNALSEMRRVLKPGGRALILEFSLPSSRVMRSLHLFYLRHLLPHLGRMISGDDQAYRYLNQTIETFPYGVSFCSLMTQVGFVEASFIPLTFGVVSIYIGEA